MTTASLADRPAPADPIHRQQCLDQAARCRRLAQTLSDPDASNALLSMARDYERSAWANSQPI